MDTRPVLPHIVVNTLEHLKAEEPFHQKWITQSAETYLTDTSLAGGYGRCQGCDIVKGLHLEVKHCVLLSVHVIRH